MNPTTTTTSTEKKTPKKMNCIKFHCNAQSVWINEFRSKLGRIGFTAYSIFPSIIIISKSNSDYSSSFITALFLLQKRQLPISSPVSLSTHFWALIHSTKSTVYVRSFFLLQFMYMYVYIICFNLMLVCDAEYS